MAHLKLVNQVLVAQKLIEKVAVFLKLVEQVAVDLALCWMVAVLQPFSLLSLFGGIRPSYLQ